MRKYILFAFLVHISFHIYSQGLDTVVLNGCFIQRFLKSEITTSLNNKSSQMIDYTMRAYYFTFKINNCIKIIKQEEIQHMLLHSDYKNTEIYKFPPFSEHYKKLIPNLNVTDNHMFKGEHKYYALATDTTHLYRIFFIDAKALRLIVENDYFNSKRNFDLSLTWSIDPFLINESIPSFYVYLLYEFYNICSMQPLKGFTEYQTIDNQ